MKRIGFGTTVLLVLITACMLHGPQSARSQDQTTAGSLVVWAKDHPYFVGLYQNGLTIRTGNSSGGFGHDVSFEKVPVGDYELRIEAAGYQTQIYHAHVAMGQQTIFDSISPKGEGTQIWGKGPTLSELIERLAKLEATQCNCSKK